MGNERHDKASELAERIVLALNAAQKGEPVTLDLTDAYDGGDVTAYFEAMSLAFSIMYNHLIDRDATLLDTLAIQQKLLVKRLVNQSITDAMK